VFLGKRQWEIPSANEEVYENPAGSFSGAFCFFKEL
jgi:hypothetical protein